MSNTKTEAQWLADAIDPGNEGSKIILTIDVAHAAAELRRLDAENQRQRADLERKSEAILRIWAERDQLRAQLSKAVAEERKPLTEVEMEKGREQLFSTNNPYCPCDRKTFKKVAEWVERHHGIAAAIRARSNT